MKRLIAVLAAAVGLVAGAMADDEIDLSEVTSDITIADGTTLTGTLSGNHKLSIADGATVTLRDMTINGVSNGSYKWAGITCEGDATIVLEGENTVRGFNENFPGIYVPEGKTLTMNGEGALTAKSNGCAAGIGSGDAMAASGLYDVWCDGVVINGGTVVATGGINGAGIGARTAFLYVASENGSLAEECSVMPCASGLFVEIDGETIFKVETGDDCAKLVLVGK